MEAVENITVIMRPLTDGLLAAGQVWCTGCHARYPIGVLAGANALQCDHCGIYLVCPTC